MTITRQQVDAWDDEVDAAYASGVAAGAAAEREACAKVADEYVGKDLENNFSALIAQAIRARGNV